MIKISGTKEEIIQQLKITACEIMWDSHHLRVQSL